jgi:hypothetical protein
MSSIQLRSSPLVTDPVLFCSFTIDRNENVLRASLIFQLNFVKFGFCVHYAQAEMSPTTRCILHCSTCHCLYAGCSINYTYGLYQSRPPAKDNHVHFKIVYLSLSSSMKACNQDADLSLFMQTLCPRTKQHLQSCSTSECLSESFFCPGLDLRLSVISQHRLKLKATTKPT